jgi:UDP-N-acetylglucosamine diphosphorylase / glucose-1-phosphate thymidylyltransferase / UDP-N-acetylgalactosamine diphosphorylase / glucosamine-1-phosphate N-acetyltransferase / galactosamine-1-phosphate N-acetyltransferase
MEKKMLTPDLFFSLQKLGSFDLFPDSLLWSPLLQREKFLYSFTQKIPSDVAHIYLRNQESIHIEDGAIIEPGVTIVGPSFIGALSHLKSGAYINQSYIGQSVVVGHGSEITRSFLFSKARAAHFNYVGDSVVGCSVNLGAGVKCANLRLDRASICIRSGQQKIDTGLQKMGAIIGDHCQIGCNAVCNPGVILPKNSVVLPLSNPSGVHLPKGSSSHAY